MSAMNLTGDLATTHIWNSLTQSQSCTNLEDGKTRKKTKIKMVLALELACGSIPKSYYPAARGFEEFHVHITFDYRCNQQDLGLSLRHSQMVTTIHQECKIMKSWQYDIEVPCIVQKRLLWYSAQSHLNEVLIKIGTLKICYE